MVIPSTTRAVHGVRFRFEGCLERRAGIDDLNTSRSCMGEMRESKAVEVAMESEKEWMCSIGIVARYVNEPNSLMFFL